MPRMARVVVPGVPHHVTQRGNRRMKTFLRKSDYDAYIALMADWCARLGVKVWAYCLMPNHIHLMAVPSSEDVLARAVGEAHRRYSRLVNFREGVRGYLFQGRFGSCVLDERHLLAAVRYVELNPVAAGVVDTAAAYEWSSAAYRLGRERSGPLVADRTLLGRVGDWTTFLQDGIDETEARRLERALAGGLPCGSAGFVEGLERRFGGRLTPGRPGRPRKKRRRGQ